jgi:electron-transferring-flavoprotein dehydrogenase
MVEWGAKTIPEGGYFALPERRAGDGVVMLGDAGGFVDVPSLKGIHYAMQSGMYAARAIFQNLKTGAPLNEYDRQVDASYVVRDLYRTRNMRLAFRDGFYLGGFQAALMTLTGGRFPGGRYRMHADAEVRRTPRSRPGSEPPVGISKVDAVFKSGNSTRDTIPSHLVANGNVPPEVARFYAHLCPAGVYEATDGGGLRINAPNCVDCKATDVLGPRWTPREGGSGPKYKRM